MNPKLGNVLFKLRMSKSLRKLHGRPERISAETWRQMVAVLQINGKNLLGTLDNRMIVIQSIIKIKRKSLNFSYIKLFKKFHDSSL